LALVGRRKELLEETEQALRGLAAEGDAGNVPSIKLIPSDISSEEGRAKIAESMEDCGQNLKFLVHNAGIIEPLEPALEIELDKWRSTIATNLEAPLFLTQSLKPLFIDPSSSPRVLFVGSGAAHNPFHSWGAYCTSKAAMNMLWRVLKHEKGSKEGILYGSVRPGVVDTPMQQTIRKSTSPMAEFCNELRETGKLATAEEVGRFMEFLLYDTDPDEYQADEWDIRDRFHHSRWS